jgi:prepilin-type N-terminal cleavage/methylation domain-containing protein
MNDSIAKSRGFTLVELLVVIAIIGLLSTVAVVATNSSRDKARYARTIADMEQISKAAELYYSANGSYPGDVAPGLLPAGLAAYLATWPKPPCSNWVYDWQNWSSGNVIQVNTAISGSGYQFQYCIYAAPGNACTGGVEITSYSSKSITCNEGPS